MAFQTNPATLISAASLYKMSALANLFGIPLNQMRVVLLDGAVYQILGAKVLNWVNSLAGSGSFNYVNPAGMTAATVAAFQANH